MAWHLLVIILLVGMRETLLLAPRPTSAALAALLTAAEQGSCTPGLRIMVTGSW